MNCFDIHWRLFCALTILHSTFLLPSNLRADENQIKIQEEMYQLRLQRGDIEKAHTIALEMTRNAPDSAVAWEALLDFYLRPGSNQNPKKAIEAADKAISLLQNPEFKNRRITLMHKILEAQGVPADVPTEKSQKVNEDKFNMLYEQLMVEQELGNFKAMLKILEQLEETDSKHPGVWYGYGEVYGSSGKNFDAMKAIAAFSRYKDLLKGPENREKRMAALRMISKLEEGTTIDGYRLGDWIGSWSKPYSKTGARGLGLEMELKIQGLSKDDLDLKFKYSITFYHEGELIAANLGDRPGNETRFSFQELETIEETFQVVILKTIFSESNDALTVLFEETSTTDPAKKRKVEYIFKMSDKGILYNDWLLTKED